MWSGIGRIDWMVDHTAYPDGPWQRAFNQHIKNYHAGNWWNSSRHEIDEVVKSYSKYQNNHTFAMSSWFAMTNLSNYLIVNEYEFFYTSFINYDNNENIKGEALTVPVHTVLSEMGLEIDKTNWLKLTPEQYFGNWARKNDLLADDNFHPGKDGPLRWPREVLYPLLKNMNILYE